MKKFGWQLTILFLSTTSAVFPQLSSRSGASDFPLSGERTPSTFLQSDVRLFPMRPHGYVAVWSDDRDGEPGFYAQKFDSAGGLLGKNYPTFSNASIQFAPNGEYLSLKEHSWQYNFFLDEEYRSIDGQFSDSADHALKSASLATVMIPWCGTGYLGVDFAAAAAMDKYIFLLRNDGIVSLLTYDRSGTFLSDIPSNLDWEKRAVAATVAVNANNDYMVATYQITHDFHVRGYFGTFFDANDSVIAADVPLGIPFDSSAQVYFGGNRGLLKAISLPDSTYELFAITPDSAIVYFCKFDRAGNPVGAVQATEIPHGQSDFVQLGNFSISNILNGSFDILITNIEYGPNGVIRQNGIYPFSDEGDFLGGARFDSTVWLLAGENFVKLSDSVFLFGVSESADAYLTRYSWFSALDSVKLNDDGSGSNEVLPFVTPVNDERFYVSWNDGTNNAGGVFDVTGLPEHGPETVDGPTREFFDDGTSVSLWLHPSPLGQDTLGFTFWNMDWTPAARETVTVGGCCGYTTGTVKILTDSTFIVLYRNSYDAAYLKLYTRAGRFLAETPATGFGTAIDLRILINDAESFWAHVGTGVRLFSNGLLPMSEPLAINAQLCLEPGRFLTVTRDSYVPTYRGTIVTIDNDTLRRDFLIASGADEIMIGTLTAHRFLTLVRHGSTLYAKTFTSEGLPDHDSVVVHSTPGGKKKHGTFTARGGNVFFAWSEIRAPGLGYSIFGNVFSVSDLVGVGEVPVHALPAEFSLEQNYPNPFNPVTHIRYGLRDAGYVTLKIYDVLGREVATLVDEDERAGYKSVMWDATSKPSGVYFCVMRAGSFSETRKLVLLR